MPRILNLKHPGTRAALLHPALAGLPKIGAGAWCAVFDRGDTVMKLTADSIQAGFYSDYCRPQGDHFPRLVENHGAIGEQGEFDLYLIEMEKLTPFGKKKDTPIDSWVARRDFMRCVTRHRDKHVSGYWNIKNPVEFNTRIGTVTFQSMSEDESLTEDMRGACEDLSNFIGNYGAAMDVHRGNLMLRGETLILNDVVADNESMCAMQSRRDCW